MNARGRWRLLLVVAGYLGLAGRAGSEGGASGVRAFQPRPPSVGSAAPRASSYEALRGALLGLPADSALRSIPGRSTGPADHGWRRGQEGEAAKWLELP